MSRRSIVAVLFGGRSVEHDVSIVTGQQIIEGFPADRYEVVPVYITRDGRWFTGAPLLQLENFQDEALLEKDGIEACLLSPDTRHHGLVIKPLAGRFSRSRVQRLDVAFPALHGSHGEDGSLQGLLELADIPYVGCATLGSALSNDKIMTKLALRQAGVPVLDDMWLTREAWTADPDELVAEICERFAFPLFIKPACLGSSIGIGRADDEALLRASIDVVVSFDRRILIEPALTDCIEINCAVMGYGDDFEASPLEQPLGWDDFLSYEDKYLRGGEGMKSAERIIPAPLDAELYARIQALSIEAFKAVDGRGIARIDYLTRPQTGEVYLNEINTLPGSLAFYLWHEAGYSRAQALERLVELARAAHADKRRNSYDYQTDLLSIASQRGSKGVKGKG
ncbi:MAG: D-alanine--D-alanine ligase [Chloroflexi bacterium]|nr:D-alanine--D-alanine ligase [Chloroflexota bacterium]MYA92117.1 D-alanine--D-alanine ligase [Chloroflexota bacterium]MYD37324.1 D-alanine--D-alanine ligase [Chloroflexota bacterium]MYI40870.1 D-alanine--D-alanine ligase [Chloroflexota bacterium]